MGPNKNKGAPGVGPLAGKSGVQRRPGGLTPVGGYDRSSNSGAGMANRGGGAFGPGGAAGPGQRRPGAGVSDVG